MENENKEIHNCCICHKFFKGWGNNPDGAAWQKKDGSVEFGKFGPKDVCCDECNSNYVIPGRIYAMKIAKEER